MSSPNENLDKAGSDYWSDVWQGSRLPSAIDPDDRAIRNYVNRQLHVYFQYAFSGMHTQSATLLEIGAARSEWLPYFSKVFGFAVTGLDYSEIGCQQANQILVNEGVQGECVCADFHTPPIDMIGKFDVIVSIGVLEHFENTQQVLEAFSRFLKPSGLMVTLIPNMVGLVGFLHKIINRPVYDIHVPLSREQLLAAHQTVGLEILDGQYFLFTNFGVINLVGISPRTFAGFIRRGILFGLNRLSAASWFIEERVAKFKPNWLTSPYVICLARKTSP